MTRRTVSLLVFAALLLLLLWLVPQVPLLVFAAALLGVGGTVVVCHGAAGSEDVASGIALAAHLWRRDAAGTVRALLADIPHDLAPDRHDTEVAP